MVQPECWRRSKSCGAMKAEGYRPRHAIEVVDFLAEEPSDYGVSCVGSRAIAGVLDDKMLAYTNPAGETLSDAMTRVGGDMAHLDRARRSDIAGYLELHIEQGMVLQNNKIDLGLVTAIVGITRIEVVFEGAADHAGTTLMEYRKDASLAAARLLLFVSEQAHDFAARKQGHFVATTGILEIHPNASNVVPGRARMVFDIRAEDHAMIGEFLTALDAESQAAAERFGVKRSQFSTLSSTKPTICDRTSARPAEARRRRRLDFPPCRSRPAPGTTRPLSPALRRVPCCSFPAVTAKVTLRKSGRRSIRSHPGRQRFTRPSACWTDKIGNLEFNTMRRILGPRDVEFAVKGGSVFAAGGGGWADHGRMLGTAAVNAGNPNSSAWTRCRTRPGSRLRLLSARLRRRPSGKCAAWIM